VGELRAAEQLISPQESDAKAVAGGAVPHGTASSNCGLSRSCSPDEFPVHLYSGKENVNGPRICINGK